MTAPAVPPALARNAVAAWGPRGERWLAALPGTLGALARDWGLELGEPFELSYHWVCGVRAGGVRAVLKVGPPGADHLAAEAAALSAWGGAGAVRLLRSDVDRGALLLERAEPGTAATGLVPDADEQATAAAVAVLRRLHATPPPAEGLPTVCCSRSSGSPRGASCRPCSRPSGARRTAGRRGTEPSTSQACS